MNNSKRQATLGTQEKSEETIRNEEFKDTGNIGHAREKRRNNQE